VENISKETTTVGKHQKIMAYEENEPETKPRTLMFFGSDLAKIPCFRNSYMYGISAGTATGVLYNLATSKSPFKLAFCTYGLVTFGFFFHCRYQYRTSQIQIRKMEKAIQARNLLEGTQQDPGRNILNATEQDRSRNILDSLIKDKGYANLRTEDA